MAGTHTRGAKNFRPDPADWDRFVRRVLERGYTINGVLCAFVQGAGEDPEAWFSLITPHPDQRRTRGKRIDLEDPGDR